MRSLNSRAAPDGETTMHFAAIRGDVNIFEFLRKRKVSVDSRTRNDDYPLHYAIRNRNSDFAMELIEYSKDSETLSKSFSSVSKSD